MIPLSLYIHIPWCIQKCPYCDFNSHQLNIDTNDNNGLSTLENTYIHSLIKDLTADITKYDIQQRSINTIFIGGGTPSIFSGQAIASLLSQINQLLTFTDNIEITLEANPGTADAKHFKNYLHAGVNRLSIGVQSFNNQHLQQLGRIHNANTAERTIKLAQDVGFDNINIDLMHGLPQQRIVDAVTDIETALTFNTPHLSYYQLTIEPNTAFYQNPPRLPPEDTLDDISEAAFARLKDHGFKRYEVSAWSQNRPCRHNLNYWQYADYLGIGAGAHGKISHRIGDDLVITRTAKARHPKTYQSNQQLQEERIVQTHERPFEFMLNALRLQSGFDKKWMVERGGFMREAVDGIINALINEQLLLETPTHLLPSERGYLFLNELIERFLVEP